ncbi:MAG: hypothetical protein DWH81_00060 [Planctomycetota bacterium]|nr:MAG: hypothetical protein DWH81_00060 [Planctomycetota bacterium]
MPLVPPTGPAATLMQTLEAERVDQTTAQQAIQTFLNACSQLTQEERQSQFDTLLSIVDERPTGPACFLSGVCGAVLEQGAWPGRMGEILQRLLEEILPQASYLARESQKREQLAIPPRTSFASAEEEEAHYQEVEKVGVQAFEELSAAHPLARDAWNYLGALWPACVALYSLNVPSRERAKVVLPVLEPLSNRHEGAYWLQKLLNVLDQEPLLVIDPVKETGITARVSGVSDNFQLNTLLLEVFPRGWLERRRISQSAFEIASGIGPQFTRETITGTWNLYQSTAITPEGRLTAGEEAARHWIWGEGSPSDISIVDGYRVIILGPPTHYPSWSSVRHFKCLRASIDEVQVLDKSTLRQWLKRLASR